MTRKEMFNDIIRLYPDKDENPIFVIRVIKKGDAATTREPLINRGRAGTAKQDRSFSRSCSQVSEVQNCEEVESMKPISVC